MAHGVYIHDLLTYLQLCVLLCVMLAGWAWWRLVAGRPVTGRGEAWYGVDSWWDVLP